MYPEEVIYQIPHAGRGVSEVAVGGIQLIPEVGVGYLDWDVDIVAPILVAPQDSQFYELGVNNG